MLALCFTMSFLQASTEGNNQGSLDLASNAVSIEELVQLQQPRFLEYLSMALSFTEKNNRVPLSSVNTVIFIKELVEQTFFSKYLPFHDQLNNRTICKSIKNHSFENQTKKEIQYWIEHSYHLPAYNSKEFELFSRPGTLHQQALNTPELVGCCRLKQMGEIIDSGGKNSKTSPMVDVNFLVSEFEAYTFLKFLEESYPDVESTSRVIIDNQLYTQYLLNKHQRSDITPKVNTFLSFLFRNKDFSIYIAALRNFISCDLVQKQQYRNICGKYTAFTLSAEAKNNMLDTLKNNIDVFYVLFHRHIVDKYIQDKGYYAFTRSLAGDGFFARCASSMGDGLFGTAFKKPEDKGRYYHKLFNKFFKNNEASEKIIKFINENPKFKNIQQEIAVEFLSYEKALENAFSGWAIQTLSPYSFLTFSKSFDVDLVREIYNQKKDELQEFLSQQNGDDLVYFSKKLEKMKRLLNL